MISSVFQSMATPEPKSIFSLQNYLLLLMLLLGLRLVNFDVAIDLLSHNATIVF